MMKFIYSFHELFNYIINGRIGKRHLRQPFLLIWRLILALIVIYLFFHFIMFPFYEWWDGIIYRINYIIWGR